MAKPTKCELNFGKALCNFAVAPLAGAWIEIVVNDTLGISLTVAPLAGAWIEIRQLQENFNVHCVAPLAGAWIEMISARINPLSKSSLPSRERGLKCYARAEPEGGNGRSPRGSVD